MKTTRSTSITGVLLAGVAAGSLLIFSVVAQQTAGDASFGLGPMPRTPDSAADVSINLPNNSGEQAESSRPSGEPTAETTVAQLAGESTVGGFAPPSPESFDRSIRPAHDDKAWREDDEDVGSDDDDDDDWDDETGHTGQRGKKDHKHSADTHRASLSGHSSSGGWAKAGHHQTASHGGSGGATHNGSDHSNSNPGSSKNAHSKGHSKH